MMCGNGLCCFVKYLVEQVISIKDNYKIETRSGIREIKYDFNSSFPVIAEIGTPFYDQNLMQKKINIEDIEHEIYSVNIGEIHCCIILHQSIDFDKLDLEKVFNTLENKYNLDIIRLIGESSIKVRIREAGVGETFACGTGSCSSSFVMRTKNIIISNIVDVHTKGGITRVLIDQDIKKFSICANPKFIYSGLYNLSL